MKRKPEPKKRVILYLRVSNLEQVEGYSLDAQRRAMRDWCAMYSDEYEVVGEEADEGISAKYDSIDKRPGFRAAVEAVEDGRADAIMVHKFDRAARNLFLFLQVMLRIEGKLISVMQRMDYTTPEGKLSINMLMAFSQYYSDNLSSEVLKGLNERRHQGLWLGTLPFGAAKQPGDEEGKMPPVPDTSERTRDARGRSWSRHDVLVRIFELAAAGTSLAEICRQLREFGFDLPQSTVHYILHNRFYVGELRVQSEAEGDSWVQGAHEPLVDVALFERAQSAPQANRRGAGTVRKSARRYPLTGLCVCGSCGSALHCDTSKGRARLHCYSRRTLRACEQRIVQQGPIEAQILEHVRDLRPPDEIVPELLKMVKDEVPNTRKDRQRLQRRLKKIQEMYLDDDLPEAEYRTEKGRIKQELALLDSEPHPVSATEEMLTYLNNFDAWYADADEEERNAMLNHVLTRVVVRNDEVVALGLVPTGHFMVKASQSLLSGWNTSSPPGSAGASPPRRGCGTGRGRHAREGRA